MTNPPDTQPDLDRAALARATLKAMPAVRETVRSWRELTGGGAGTLIACSGGADSVALTLALWSACATANAPPLSVGHVVHDLRPEPDALADRDLVRALADRLGIPFVESSIKVAGAGNDEGAARTRRYAALVSMAGRAGLGYVASAHHANDQLESMLMAIARGSGLEGLAGVAASRPLGLGVTLIRPMLSGLRTDAEAICQIVGARWAHDATNDDTERFRSAVRGGPARLLTEIRPAAPLGAVRAGDLLRDAAMLVRDREVEVFGVGTGWDRAELRSERAVVLGAGLRTASLRLTGGDGADRLSRRVIDPVVRAIRDDSTERRHFHWPGGIEVTVTAHRIELVCPDPSPDQGAPNDD